MLAGLGFLVGWRYRLRRQGLLLGSVATAAIIALDTLVFWQFRIILPIVLALLAWFLGEFLGSISDDGSAIRDTIGRHRYSDDQETAFSLHVG